MNKFLQWFSRIIGIGILINSAFFIPALFAPKFLQVSLGLPLDATPLVWMGNAGMLLLSLSLFYVPAAFAPNRYPIYTWLTVFSRFIAVGFWISIVRTPGLTGIFVPFLIMDSSLGIILGILLNLGLPEESRINWENIGKIFGQIGTLFQNIWKSTTVKIVAGLLIILVGVSSYGFWQNLVKAEPIPNYSDPAKHFKYGVIGLSQPDRLPYWIFRVLPELFADKLPEPGQLSSLGLIFEEDVEKVPEGVPVGFGYRQVGFPSIEANCALCHTSTYKATPQSKPTILLGAPAHQLDLQAFQRFLYGCASNPLFTTDNILEAIEKIHPMSFFESLSYRFFIIPITKEGLLQQKIDYSWQYKRPLQGPGRVDTFNPTKINVYHLGDDGTVGTTDLPQIWNQKKRENMYLHWDGNNNKLIERNYAAAMAVGATPKSVFPDSFKRVTDYLLTLDSPNYPFEINSEQAEKGKVIFDAECASCHAFSGKNVGQVIPIEEIGTDRHRLDSFTQELVDKFHEVGFEPWTKLDAYRKTHGYSNTPLDGIWARGPYLHHGSVPTLWDLLQPEELRPKTFYRGNNVIDPDKVGFVSDSPDFEEPNFKYDNNIVGNDNKGHLYGIDLSDDDKWSLIEYLKTL